MLASLSLGVTLFSACTGISKPVTFNENWKTNPDASSPITEILTYKVSYEKTEGLINNYDVEYENGWYTTELTTKQGEKDGELYTYYYYKTSFTIDVKYVYGSEDDSFTDTVITEAHFMRSTDDLRPIYSKKQLHSHSPLNAEAEKLSDCYAVYDYTIETEYNSDLTEGKTTITKHTDAEDITYDPDTFEIEDDARYLDNEQLLLALRGVNPSNFPTANFLVYAPFTKSVQNVKASFSSTTESTNFKFTRNSAPFEESISYRSVTLSLNEKNAGSSQTLWIAEKTDVNTNRNLILKMETPIAYSLGSLIYTLDTEVVEKS